MKHKVQCPNLKYYSCALIAIVGQFYLLFQFDLLYVTYICLDKAHSSSAHLKVNKHVSGLFSLSRLSVIF